MLSTKAFSILHFPYSNCQMTTWSTTANVLFYSRGREGNTKLDHAEHHQHKFNKKQTSSRLLAKVQ